MRDLDKMREKTVFTVDGRQLFFLFFGGSVVAVLLFSLGVIVGRKLPAKEGVAEEDPLALLDQLGAEEEDLSFPQGVRGRPAAPAPAPKPAAPAAAAPAPKPAPPPEAASPSRQAQAPPAGAEPPRGSGTTQAASTGTRYTLQLSSFQERSEAADFVKLLEEKGYDTYVVSADVPGRGLWYRVRLGDFASHQEALEAKADFERKQRIIAYVLRK